MLRIAIIGNGIAGISCALGARERDGAASITVVSGETDHFFSRTALMYAFMGRMDRRDLEPYERRTWDERRIARVRGWVEDLDADRRLLHLADGRQIPYDRLVLAVGSAPIPAPWPGAAGLRDGLVHFVSTQDLDQAERLAAAARSAVVVGGGLIGVELVECLVHHRIPTTFLVREPWYWPVALGAEEGEVVARHLRHHGVDLRLGDEVASLDADTRGRLTGLWTRGGQRVPADLLGVCIGVRPAIDRLRRWNRAPEMDRGIVVDETLATSLPGVLACGDCAEVRLPGLPGRVEATWYAAQRQGRLAAANLFGDRLPYRSPTPFNSSKLFDLEFTTVGRCMEADDGTPTVWLNHPRRPISVRLVHDGARFIGFNGIGSRWDHTVLARWMGEGRSADFVLQHLDEAQFDPEFGHVPVHTMERRDLPLRKAPVP